VTLHNPDEFTGMSGQRNLTYEVFTDTQQEKACEGASCSSSSHVVSCSGEVPWLEWETVNSTLVCDNKCLTQSGCSLPSDAGELEPGDSVEIAFFADSDAHTRHVIKFTMDTGEPSDESAPQAEAVVVRGSAPNLVLSNYEQLSRDACR